MKALDNRFYVKFMQLEKGLLFSSEVLMLSSYCQTQNTLLLAEDFLH